MKERLCNEQNYWLLCIGAGADATQERFGGVMARAFDDGSSQYLSNGSNSVVSNHPFSISLWFKTDDTVGQTMVDISDGTATTARIQFTLRATPNQDVTVFSYESGGNRTASSTSQYSTGTWQHAACSVLDRQTGNMAAYLDGGSKGTNPTGDSNNLSGMDRIFIASRYDGGASYMSGDIAEVGIWNTNLTDAEVAVLAKGYSPLMVRPQSLVAYWPLLGNLSPEIDLVGGYNMTLTNGPTKAAHPPIYKIPPPFSSDVTPFLRHAPKGLRNLHNIALFDDAVNESLVYTKRMPNWYTGNGVDVNIHFSMATATSGKVRWKAAFERIPDSGLDVDEDSFAAPNYRDVIVPSTSGNVKIRPIRFANGADMDSVVAGDQFRLKITRDAENDDASGDAELHAVELREW